ncbi:MAG: UPF0175 family protein [Candidatus Methanoplasma sp.]|nr:UPF0175 family protein [Candidatus Methanoplasma sp.]
MRASDRLILYSLGAGNAPNSEVKIQKLLFLCALSLPKIIGSQFHFDTHKKGPYSEEINEMLHVFSDEGLIDSNYRMTEVGRELHHALSDRIKEPVKGVVEDYVEFISGLTENELLTFVYTIDPSQQSDSEVWEGLKKSRVETAASMLKKGKISFSRAADVSGLDLGEFEEYLMDNNVRWRDSD